MQVLDLDPRIGIIMYPDNLQQFLRARSRSETWLIPIIGGEGSGPYIQPGEPWAPWPHRALSRSPTKLSRDIAVAAASSAARPGAFAALAEATAVPERIAAGSRVKVRRQRVWATLL